MRIHSAVAHIFKDRPAPIPPRHRLLKLPCQFLWIAESLLGLVEGGLFIASFLASSSKIATRWASNSSRILRLRAIVARTGRTARSTTIFNSFGYVVHAGAPKIPPMIWTKLVHSSRPFASSRFPFVVKR